MLDTESVAATQGQVSQKGTGAMARMARNNFTVPLWRFIWVLFSGSSCLPFLLEKKVFRTKKRESSVEMAMFYDIFYDRVWYFFWHQDMMGSGGELLWKYMEYIGILWARFQQPEWKKCMFSDGSSIFNPFLRRLQGAEGGHKGLGFNLSQLTSCWSDLFEKWGSEMIWANVSIWISWDQTWNSETWGSQKFKRVYCLLPRLISRRYVNIAVRWWTSSGKKLVDLLQTLKKCQWHNIFWN